MSLNGLSFRLEDLVMCPQPLSTFQDNNLEVFVDALRERQEFASDIMRIINIWSMIEVLYTELLCNFLDADMVTTTALYTSVVNPKTRLQMMDKAAEKALSDDNVGLQLYRDTQNAIKPARSHRNDFAHYIWCIAPGIENSICLLNPSDHSATHASIHQYAANFAKERNFKALAATEMIEHIDKSKVRVYRERDMQEEVRMALEAHNLMRLLNLCFFKQKMFLPELDLQQVRDSARGQLSISLKSQG